MKVDLSAGVQCVNCLNFEHPHPRFGCNEIGRCKVTDAPHDWIETHHCEAFEWDDLIAILSRITRIETTNEKGGT